MIMMKKAVNCINKNLVSLYQASAKLESLNHQILNFLPKHVQSQIKVISFEKGQLTLKALSPTISTELRFLLPELRTQLRQEAGLYQLVSIKIC